MLLQIAQSRVTEHEKSMKFSTSAFEFIKIPFDVGFYLLGCPIKPQIDENEGCLYYKTSFIQKTLCILVQGLAVFSHLVDLFGFLRGPPTTQNPIKLYKITQDCIATFLYLTLIANCWKHKFGFKNLIGTFYRYHNLREKSTQRLVSRYILTGWCCFNTAGYVLIRLVNSYGFGYSFKIFWLKLKDGSSAFRYNLFLDANRTITLDEDMTIGMTGFSVVVFIVNFSGVVVGGCIGAVSVSGSYAIYRISLEYRNFLENYPNISLEKIRESYRDLKDLLKSFNESCSTVYLLNILSMIPFFGIQLTGLLDADDWSVKMEIMFHWATAIIALTYAAKANYNFRYLLDYVYEHQNRLLENGRKKSEFVIFLSHLNSSIKSNGIQGGKFFTITFNFIGTLTGTVTTFIIIQLQFNYTK